MATFSIAEAEAGLKDLVNRASQGEEIIVAEPGKAPVKLVALESPAPATKRRLRPAPGSLGGDFSELLKALDEPWDEEEQRAFGMLD